MTLFQIKYWSIRAIQGHFFVLWGKFYLWDCQTLSKVLKMCPNAECSHCAWNKNSFQQSPKTQPMKSTYQPQLRIEKGNLSKHFPKFICKTHFGVRGHFLSTVALHLHVQWTPTCAFPSMRTNKNNSRKLDRICCYIIPNRIHWNRKVSQGHFQI